MNNICVVCGTSITKDPGRCTNRCCASCHRRFCTEGGVTSPGHGINIEEARRVLAHAKRSKHG